MALSGAITSTAPATVYNVDWLRAKLTNPPIDGAVNIHVRNLEDALSIRDPFFNIKQEKHLEKLY